MTTLLSSEFTQNLASRIAAIRVMPPPLPSRQRSGENIMKVSTGGFVAIGGKTYQVTEKARWGSESDGSTELKLFCLNDGSLAFVEWWHDGIELKCQISKTRLNLRDIGLVPRNIENLGETSELRWGGWYYHYEGDYDLPYKKEGQEEPEEPHLYLFKTEDGEHSLSVQDWGDGVHDVWASDMLDSDAVEVLNLGNGAPK